MTTLTESQAKVLGIIYLTTDCSNGVWGYAKLHHTQGKIAEAMPDLVEFEDGIATADGDGRTITPERYGRGYRLKPKGYDALHAHDPLGYPMRRPKSLSQQGGGQ